MIRYDRYSYWEKQQNPDDVYYRYRKQKQEIQSRDKAQTAAEYLESAAVAAFKEKISKALNNTR